MPASEYVDVETARAATGTRIITSALVPSPWSEAAKGLFDAKNKEYVSASKKLSPYQLGAYEGGLAVLAVLFVGLALTTGRSPGKFVTKLHLIGADGQRASVSAILIRYLVVFGFKAILGVFLGQIAWVIAIFGVSSSARSPQRQGWHDRIAKTYVAQG